MKLLIISFLYIALVLLFGYALNRAKLALYARKTVHILSSLWILVAFDIENIFLRVSGPLFFLIFNYFFLRKEFEKAVGLVLYPVSLIIMFFMNFLSLISAVSVITSTLVLGLADGAAAVVGGILKKKEKSLAGSLTFLFLSFVIIFLLTGLNPFIVLLLSLSATLIEYFSSSFDNLLVPLILSLLIEVAL